METAPPMPLPVITFTDTRLSNGLRVIISEDHLAPVVAVNLWYNVGSKHEVEGKTGFAHLFEHVMFQGSRNVGKAEHMALIQAAGRRSTAAPGSTGRTTSRRSRRTSSSSPFGWRPTAWVPCWTR